MEEEAETLVSRGSSNGSGEEVPRRVGEHYVDAWEVEREQYPVGPLNTPAHKLPKYGMPGVRGIWEENLPAWIRLAGKTQRVKMVPNPNAPRPHVQEATGEMVQELEDIPCDEQLQILSRKEVMRQQQSSERKDTMVAGRILTVY